MNTDNQKQDKKVGGVITFIKIKDCIIQSDSIILIDPNPREGIEEDEKGRVLNVLLASKNLPAYIQQILYDTSEDMQVDLKKITSQFLEGIVAD